MKIKQHIRHIKIPGNLQEQILTKQRKLLTKYELMGMLIFLRNI
jgi:hypothetical protein